ncbi:serine hydrolase domain-containing protein [Deinococcus yavapaiensis]|uniref:CubicO group peptidase (Beta-lactamase class C family) n=1 Tax=Deinococcus yavapaiensis KR-236 TaxID=694435 RepID=A0A318SGJ6_9DEIO|nr:serine hydrolase domain-containing protein [Deinococcus yavapaiensis]PYE49384.1 CubicO group peptidase (beta-lactamase class C family) [Deinococcus yavapaiensis KR-236]
MLPSALAFDDSTFENVRRVVDDAVEQGTHPSAVVTIARGDGTAWSHVAPGLTSHTFTSRFPIASITKPIVALALMRLVERGALLVGDPVARHLPSFARNGKERVTVRHLLTHTSGLSVPEDVSNALWLDRATREAYVEAAFDAPLAFEPGSHHAYVSVHGFEVLAALVTHLAQRDFTRVLHEEVFAPLGMIDTSFDVPDESRLAHAPFQGGRDELAYWASLTFASGGLMSTASDLLALGLTLLRGGRSGSYRLLSAGTLEVMTRLHTRGLRNDSGFAFQALGWGKRSDAGVLLASDASFGHSGATGAFLWIDPVYDVVFVFLSSEGGTEPHRVPMLALNATIAALT